MQYPVHVGLPQFDMGEWGMANALCLCFQSCAIAVWAGGGGGALATQRHTKHGVPAGGELPPPPLRAAVGAPSATGHGEIAASR
eukprot:COSAG01_NODE_10650_length_2112_cov_1.469945_1_plen_83_part_10